MSKGRDDPLFGDIGKSPTKKSKHFDKKTEF